MDDVEKLLEDLNGPSEPQRVFSPQENWVEDLVEGREPARQLRSAMDTGSDPKQDLTPEKMARIVRMQMKTGLPEDLILDNLDLVEREAKVASFDPERLRRDNPVIAGWLSDPKHAAMARDEVADLQGLEWLMGRWTFNHSPLPGILPNIFPEQVQKGAPQKAYGEGERQVELAAARWRQLLGMADESDLARIEELKRNKPKDLGDEGFWAGVATQAAQQLPQLERTAQGALSGASAGAAAGAAFGGLGAIPGAIVGGKAGAALVTNEQEGGGAYDEFLDKTDEQGRHFNPLAARGAALAVGAVNTGLEMFSLSTLVTNSPLRHLYKQGIRDLARSALEIPTVRAALIRSAKEYGETLTVEGATEFAQEAVTILGGELARRVSDGDFRGTTMAEGLARALQAGKAGLQASILLGLPGPIADAVGGARQAQVGEVNRRIMGSLADAAKGSKLRTMAPEKYREMVDRVAAAGGGQNVYTRFSAWTTYWQSQGVDPREAYLEIGGKAVNYDEAVASAAKDGSTGDLVTPTAIWAERLAATPHHQGLMEDSTLFQGGYTPRELADFEANADKVEQEHQVLFQQALEQAKAEPPTPVEAELIRQYQEGAGATGRVEEAEANTLILRAMARTMVARWNQAATKEGRPLETVDTLFKGYGITVVDGRPSLTPPQALPPQATQQLAAEATAAAEAETGAKPPAAEGELSSTLAAAPVVEAPPAGEGPALPAVKAPDRGVPTWPTRPERGAKFKPAEAQQRMDELNAAVAAAQEVELEAPIAGAPGRTVIVHRTVSDEGGPWRVTSFENGTPTGHDVFSSYQAALKDAWYRGAELDKAQLPTTPDPVAALDEVYGAAPVEVQPAPRGLGPGQVVPGGPQGPATFAFSTIEPDKKIPMVYRAIELDQLVTSHDESGQPDPRYPPELQQWNRATAASRGQVEMIGAAQSFDNLLVEQHALDRGAPIIGNGEPFIESGNGRTIGLKKARAADSPAWRRYQEQLALMAPELGMDLRGMTAPVLVRERTEPLTPEARVEFTRDANARAAREPSPVERAKVDAERLTPELIARLPISEQGSVDDALRGAAGASWMREFLSGVPAGEWGRFVDPSGQVGMHGIAAIKLALFRRVFGDGGDRILQSFTEIAGEQKANLEKALFGALPRLATLVGGIQTGQVEPGLDITGDIANAIDQFRRLKAEGTTVQDFLKQGAMFGRELDPFQEHLLEVVSENARRGGRLASMLSAYANAALALPPPSQQALFAAEPVTKLQLWQKAESGAAEPEGPRATLFQDTIESLEADAMARRNPGQAIVSIIATQTQAGYSPETDLEAFQAATPEQQEALASMYLEAVSNLEGHRALVEQLAADVGGVAVPGPIKTIARTLQKANRDYGGDVRQVRDLLRGSVVAPTVEAAREAAATLAQVADVTRVKDRMDDPGFQSILTNVRLSGGLEAEIQLEIPEMFEAGRIRTTGHLLYEKWRVTDDQDEARQLEAEILDYYADARARYDARAVGEDAEAAASQALRVVTRNVGASPAASVSGTSLAPSTTSNLPSTLATGRSSSPISMREAEAGTSEGLTERSIPSGEQPGKRTLFQQAYHGSPVRGIEKLSTAFLGTGQGAQVFGWGNYLAELPVVAEGYRTSLAEMELQGEGIPNTRDQAAKQDGHAGTIAWDALETGLGVPDMEPWAYARKIIAPYATGELRDDQFDADTWAEAIGLLRKWEAAGAKPVKGQLYKVDIPEEEDLLDWDAPMAEQPPGVLAKLKEAGLWSDEQQAIGEQWKVAREAVREAYGDMSRAADRYADLLSDWRQSPEAKLDWDLKDLPPKVREAYDVQQRAKVEHLQAQWRLDELRKRYGRASASTTGETFYRNIAEDAGTDERASKELLEAGIPGLRYLDQGSRGEGKGTHNYVIWDDQAVKILETYYQDKRAAVDVPAGTGARQFLISLFRRADRSSLVHETSHVFLELLGDLAEREDAPPEVKADWATTLRELGVTDRSQIGAKQHEQWAKSFEAYMFEGKTPSPELAAVFARFRAWLVALYRDIKALGVTVSPELKGVFDRMLATDDEINRAEQEAVTRPLFPTGPSAGMNPAEYVAYRLLSREAHDQAVSQLEGQMLADAERETKAWWKEAKDQVRDEVVAEIDKRPHRRAEAALRRGTEPDGTPLAERVHLDADGLGAVLDALGIDRREMKRKLALTWRRQGGVHPDVAAERFGFSSGDQLVKALIETPARSAEITAEVSQRMTDRYGDLLEEATRRRESAMEAVHGEARGRLLLTELRALGRKVGQNVPTAEHVVREFARRLVEGQRVRDILPVRYQRAEATAARQAETALALGDFPAALEAKRRQTLNHWLYREAVRAKEEAESSANYLGRMAGEPARRRLGKAGKTYLDQVDELLERFEIRQRTLRALDRRASLREWLDEQRQLGNDVAIPEQLLDDTYQKNWREMTPAELTHLEEAVRNIERLARLKNTLVTRKGRRDFAETKAGLIEALKANLPDHGPLPLDPQTRTAFERGKRLLQQGDASLLKIEELVRRMDGGRADGPWSEAVWGPIEAAQHLEDDLTLQYTQALVKIMGELPAAFRNRMLDQRNFEKLGQPLTYQAMIAIALNTGNESNYQKLMNGRPRGALNWDPDVIEEVLSQLSREDWQFVQKVWDTIETLWPKIEALEQRLTGIAPPKVKATPITRTFKDGSKLELRGGYYPVAYDRRQSNVGRKQAEEAESVADLFDYAYVRAMTAHGHTIERVEGFAAPIRLSLEVLPRHVTQVIHDLTHREAVLSVYRILTDNDIRTAMQERLGEAYADVFIPWLKGIANDRNPSSIGGSEFWGDFAGKVRGNAAIVSMGFKATTALNNFANIFNALEAVPGKYLSAAIGDFYRSPQSAREWSEFVKSRSSEMRHRMDYLDRDVRDALRELLGQKGVPSTIRRQAFKAMAFTDASISFPAWLGAYRHALAQDESEEAAIVYADRTVRLSLGASGAKDLSRVQRGPELMKFLTAFYSFFNVLYNRGRAVGFDARTQLAEGKSPWGVFSNVLWRSFLLWLVPALFSEWLSGRGPDDDDDETVAHWAARKALVYPFMTLPLIRSVAASIEGGYDVSFAPAGRVGEEAAKTIKATGELLVGEGNAADAADAAFQTAGYLFGLPTGQAKITGGYLWDVLSGAERPEDVWDFSRGLLYRRKVQK